MQLSNCNCKQLPLAFACALCALRTQFTIHKQRNETKRSLPAATLSLSCSLRVCVCVRVDNIHRAVAVVQLGYMAERQAASE